jgi:hypothetical protein
MILFKVIEHLVDSGGVFFLKNGGVLHTKAFMTVTGR